jgi:hypothetical protein
MKLRVLAAALAAVLLSGAGAFAATMQCAPNQVITTNYPSGATYAADAAGIVTSVSGNDVQSMQAAGCTTVGVGSGTMIGRLLGVNMNVTTDQPIPLWVLPGQYYRLVKISFKNCSISMTTAAGGIYTAAAKGGTVVVLAATTYTGLTGPTLAADLSIVAAPGTTEYAATQGLWFSLTTAQGAPGTCDAFVYGDLGQ